MTEDDQVPEVVESVDVTEASQAFLVALQLNLKDRVVLADLGKQFWEVGHFKESSMALRRSLMVLENRKQFEINKGAKCPSKEHRV